MCSSSVVVVVGPCLWPTRHYRSFRGWFLHARWPNQQFQSTEENQLVVEITLESHQNYSTVLH